MNYIRYRKHPRVYEKKVNESEEKSYSLSMAAAAGILAFTFVNGMFWGYMIKRKLR